MCFATAEDVRNNFDPFKFIPRCKQSHNEICELIQSTSNETTKSELQTNYGIIEQSCLSKLDDFDVTKQLPHDIMHVLLEGVVPYELQLCLSALMDQKLFTLEEFNYNLSNFEFSYSDAKSKPEPLKKSVFITGERKLKYSAENARVFLKIVLFLLDNFVSKDDVFFKLIADLSKIVTILFSPVLSRGTIGYVQTLIAEHCHDFKQLFPDQHPIPKHHYLLEVPSLIEMFGPPIRYSYMRFEALHKVFKRFTSVANFNNICLSLSTRYAKYIAQEQQTLLKTKEDGPAQPISEADTQIYTASYPQFNFSNCRLYSLNWIKSYGSKYIAGKCFLAMDANCENHLPIFGKLEKIIRCEKTLLLATIFLTECFSDSFNSYIVTPTQEKRMYCLEYLLDFNVYQIIKNLAGEILIPVKYDLSDIIEEHLLKSNPLHVN